MAVKAHVRAFVQGLADAPAWDPRAEASAWFDALKADPDAAAAWVATVDTVRFGHGAVAMHRRHQDRPPPPDLAGLQDFETLALCAGALRLGTLVARDYAPDADARRAAAREGARWLGNLLRMEPDFLDELLLEIAARHATDPAFAAAIACQAATLADAAADLHRQGSELLGGRTTVSDVLRSLVGAGPNLSRGEWARWTRAVVVLGCLDAKG